MSVKYHLSLTGPNRELLGVQAEGEGDGIYAEFLAAVQDVGLDQLLAQLSKAGAAVAVAGLPARAIASQPQVPAAAYQQQAPQAPAAPGGKLCDRHGLPMQYKSGSTNGRDWAFWGCTGPSNDRCDKVWA